MRLASAINYARIAKSGVESGCGNAASELRSLRYATIDLAKALDLRILDDQAMRGMDLLDECQALIKTKENHDEKTITDIDYWYEDDVGSRERGIAPSVQEAVECGSSCCAVGWAVLMLPSWQEEGFYLVRGNTYVDIKHKTITDSVTAGSPPAAFMLSTALGITRSQVDYLFYGDSYIDDVTYAIEDAGGVTPEMVVSHINDVLEGRM